MHSCPLAFQVWLDVLNDSAQAPRTSTSSIFMKVSRMKVENPNQNQPPAPKPQKTQPQKRPGKKRVSSPALVDPLDPLDALNSPAAPAPANAGPNIDLFGAPATEPAAPQQLIDQPSATEDLFSLTTPSEPSVRATRFMYVCMYYICM